MSCPIVRTVQFTFLPTVRQPLQISACKYVGNLHHNAEIYTCCITRCTVVLLAVVSTAFLWHRYGPFAQAIKNPSSHSSYLIYSESSGEASPTKHADNNGMLPFVTHVTSSCSVADLDPSHCVPRHLPRKEDPNTMAKLQKLINCKAIFSSFLISELVSASPTSVFLPRKEDLGLFLNSYLSSAAESSYDSAVLQRRVLLSYNVVDSCQLHETILQLVNEIWRKWGLFVWKVIVIHLPSKKEEYRHLASAQNERS